MVTLGLDVVDRAGVSKVECTVQCIWLNNPVHGIIPYMAPYLLQKSKINNFNLKSTLMSSRHRL